MSNEEQVHTLPAREGIEENLKWRLEDIFPSDDAWESEYNEIKKEIPIAADYKGKLGDDAETFYNALQFQSKLSQRMGMLYTYAHMRYDQDTANSHYQGINARAESLYAQFASAFSFIVPEILKMDVQTIDRFLKEKPALGVYEHALDEINRQRGHVLDADKEALLAAASEVMDASSTTFGMLNNADIEFPVTKDENGNQVQISHGNFIRFLESQSREVRKEAFQKVYETYGKYKNTFASTLSGQIKKDNFYATIRNYESARQAALAANNIPETVYDHLVSTIHENLPLLQRYLNVRKKALKVEDLHIYDLYVPLIKEVEMKVTYEEAKGILLEALKPLGSEYVNILKEGFENRWVDVMENKGKRSGAYSSGTYGTNPYILMNWQDNVNNLFTLAHEFGHSVHSYYTRKSQPYPYGNYSIFVAEVASTTNESLLIDYLLKKTNDKNERLYLINHYLEGFRGTVFRQTMFAEFEHIIHKKAQNGEALTPDLLTSEYYELNKKYFGEENLHIDKEIGLEWSRIPHFYYNYYVYQYATGFSAAAALSKQILEEGQPAVERYIDFLKAGSSDYPIEVLKKAGVDMTSSSPIQAACRVFEEKLDEMEKLLEL